MAHLERVIILIDMDCFYCQVEEKLNPNLEGKPIAVVQYNQWRGGGIIAVNYPARERGVTRHMRGQEAKEKCPEIILAKVPDIRGKADLSRYRDAGKQVAEVLQTFTTLLERASVDEAYLDVTTLVLNRMENGIDQISIDMLKNTYIVGCDTKDFLHNLTNQLEFSENNFKLCLGGIIAEEIRAEVFKQTGYKCSAGIAHNKILAKLVCGLHKPNKQTILPHDSVAEYFETLPLRKVRSLGGKFGKALSDDLSVSKMGELTNFSEKQLVEKFGRKNGSWLYNIARGIDFEPVVTRLVSKSIGCCKKFPGRSALQTHEAIQHWMSELAEEISERLEKDLVENNRKAKQMVVNFAQEINKEVVSNSRTHSLYSYNKAQIARDAVEVVRKYCQKTDGSYNVTFLGISVSNFQEEKKTQDIASFFRQSMALQEIKQKEELEEERTEFMSYDEDDLNLNNEEENDDIGNHSIYSASTEDLEEDPKSYIYFEDIYPEYASSQPLESCELTHKVDATISKEKRELEIRRKSSKSFFSKYFNNMAAANIKTPEMIMPNEEKNENIENSSNSTKLIAKANTGQNEENITMKEKRKSNEENTSAKRKPSEINILQYFPKYEEPNENYCEECKKNIPFEEIPDHSDYHVAKKLQAELNKASISDKVPVNKSIIKVTPKKKPANMSISDFFKPA